MSSSIKELPYSQTLQSISNKQIQRTYQATLTSSPMASAQCHKTCEETYQQKNQNTSFGQKVSDFFKGHHNHSNEVTKTHTTQCSSQTKVLSQSGYSTTKTETQCSCSKTQTNTKNHEMNKRGHKKGLVQNIKDRFSEHHDKNSNSDSSSSDSESDNENCHKRKN